MAAAAAGISHSLLIFLCSTILISRHFQVQASAAAVGDEELGFTVDLIHRDSTPFLNSLSKYDLIERAMQRSNWRHRQYISFNHPSSPSPTSPVLPSADGNYIMNISIGTPPVPFLGLIDTGSDLIWTQCKPCLKCYYQITPIFNPSNSSTYSSTACSSRACKSLPLDSRRCSSRKQRKCSFYNTYADGSVTKGPLATETFTFGHNKVRAPGTVFGCSHFTKSTLTRFESGLIGLGRGDFSLMGQTRKLPAFGGRFSHCLIPPFMQQTRRKLGNSAAPSTAGRISFGREAIMSGPGVVSTPLKTKADLPSQYYVTLESISVGEGKNRIPYNVDNGPTHHHHHYYSKEEGNMFLDSGTPATYLREGPYNKLVSALKDAMGAHHKQAVSKRYFDVCYQVKNQDYGSLGIPNLTFHFAGGADVEIKPSSTFVEAAKGFVCLTIMPSHEMLDRAIFGSFLQMGYTIGFDTEAKTVSFKPTPDCAAADH